MYERCGHLDGCSKVFHGMLEKDIISWNAIIDAYACDGDGYKAIDYLQLMKESGIVPDKVTFTTVLCACSHAGLVKEGYSILCSMIQEYGISPGIDHCSCIVDLFRRARHFEEAER